MILIDEFKEIFSNALIRFAEQNEIGKSKNTIMIFPDNDTDEMQLQFAYCMENENGYQAINFITWNQVYGGDDYIMNRNVMLAQFFLQLFIRLAREYKCNATDIGVMVAFKDDSAEEFVLFAYKNYELLIDFETKKAKVIPVDELFMDAVV